MATIDLMGNLQPEPGDILPREVARREDDPQPVIELIEKLNPTIQTAEDLAVAVEKVDALRRQLADETNVDNPHIGATPDVPTGDSGTTTTPAPSKLKKDKKSPQET